MASRKPRTAAVDFSKQPVTALGQVVRIPFTELDLSYENMRTGDWMTGTSSESADGNSFDELVTSIQETGQKEPVVCRPSPKHKGKLQLIAGFRRVAAIKKIAVDNNVALKNAMVDCYVKDLNDLQALEEHVLENTARDNLSGPDLAFAAYHLQEKSTAAGINMSGHQLAARMGKNQSYISSLLRIVGGAPEVARLWRDAPVQLSINEMLRIVKLKDPKLQLEEYNRLLEGKPTGQGPGGKDPVQSAIDRVTKIATLIGQLERDGLIGDVDIDWVTHLPNLGIKLKEDMSTASVHEIANAAQRAYESAASLQPPAKDEAAE